MIIYFIGFRGAGKSTLAKAMTQKTKGSLFWDCDEVFESRFGMSILQWIEKHGENSFREKEFEIICLIEAEIATCQESGEKPEIWNFVSTGGGFVEFPSSFQFLLKNPNPRIFIDCPLPLLWQRLKDAPDRLKVGNIASFSDFQRLYESRLSKYQNLATKTLVSEGASIEEDIKKLKALIFN